MRTLVSLTGKIGFFGHSHYLCLSPFLCLYDSNVPPCLSLSLFTHPLPPSLADLSQPPNHTRTYRERERERGGGGGREREKYTHKHTTTTLSDWLHSRSLHFQAQTACNKPDQTHMHGHTVIQTPPPPPPPHTHIHTVNVTQTDSLNAGDVYMYMRTHLISIPARLHGTM
jgi:hypothetical protein